MSQFENITLIKKSNMYFDGKVTSRTVVFADGSKKPWALCYQVIMSLEQKRLRLWK